MAKKIYISPSNQNANVYAYGNTNEMEQCNRIADALVSKLKSYDFEVKKAPKGQDMNVTINESNSWGADLHLPIHTNAYNGKVTGGTLVMVYNTESKNKEIAKLILNNLAEITPGKDYEIQIRPELSELCKTNCLAIYTEVEFHDTEEGAKFIVNNTDKIADAMCRAICEYYGVSSTTTTTDVTSQMYRVRKSWSDVSSQKGAFRNLDNAKKYADTYASQGYKVFDKDGKTVYTPKTTSTSTSTNIAQKFVNTAIGYIGYNCDIFNSYFGNPSGTAWCAEFVSKCANDIGAIGKCMVKTAGAGSIARESIAKGWGTWHEGHNSIPKIGDVISFTWNGLGYYPGQDKYFSDHVGIVEKVSGNTVHTIEGNANGTNITSTVCRKSYTLYNGKINGYYRPNWKLVDSDYKAPASSTSNTSTSTTSTSISTVQKWLNNNYGTTCKIDNAYGSETKSAIVGSLQCYLNDTYNAGLVVDGIMGPKTAAACRVLRRGDKGTYVYILQCALICRGYDTGGFDGDFGRKTESSVKQFQKSAGITVDGEAGPDTFTKLLS